MRSRVFRRHWKYNGGMAVEIERLGVNVINVEVIRLRDGRVVVSVTLDATYLRMIHFFRSLRPEGGRVSRKRRKDGLPPLRERRLVMNLVKPDGASAEVSGDLALVDPLDAPAVLSLDVRDAQDVPVGSRVELIVLEDDRPDGSRPLTPVE